MAVANDDGAYALCFNGVATQFSPLPIELGDDGILSH
jgi:hypothetical protein